MPLCPVKRFKILLNLHAVYLWGIEMCNCMFSFFYRIAYFVNFIMHESKEMRREYKGTFSNN